MLIAIDSGNTRTRAALFQEEQLIPYDYFETDQSLDALCRDFLLDHDCEGIIISSVSREDAILELPSNPKLFILNGNLSLPFENNYSSKATQGADRIALVAAAVAVLPQTPVLVIDAGTCVTYDFVDAYGVYAGGAIAPGLQMRLRAMHENTARLPMIVAANPVDFPGHTTEESLQAGAWNGLIYEAEGYFRALQTQYPSLQCLITGGDAPLLVERLKCGIFADQFTLHEQLVPVGLNFILKHLLKQRKP